MRRSVSFTLSKSQTKKWESVISPSTRKLRACIRSSDSVRSRVDGNDLAELVDAGVFSIGFLHGQPSPVEFLLKPPGDIFCQPQCFRFFHRCQQFRYVAGMFLAGRQANGNRCVAVRRCLSDLVALAGFLSKKAVVHTLCILVAGVAYLDVALQSGTTAAPLRLYAPPLLRILQLQVIHLVGTSLPEI